MILAIDIGNTNIVLGGIEDGEILFESRMATDTAKTSDQYHLELRSMLGLFDVNVRKLEGVIISSVAYTLFVLFPNEFGYYGSALLLGLGNGHLWPAFQNMIISMAHHNERGTANSTLLISWDVGIGLGVLCGGVISEVAGYTPAFWVVAISQLAGAVLFLIATRTFYQKHQL